MESPNQQSTKKLSIQQKNNQEKPQIEIKLTELQINKMRTVFKNQNMTVQQLSNSVLNYSNNLIAIDLNLDQTKQVERIIFILKYAKNCSINILKLKQKMFSYFFLTQISHVIFLNLKQLNLAQNNIINIEPLAYLLNCQNLETIFLQSNKISSLKSLQRTKFSRINKLVLDDNLILQFNHLTRMKFTSQQYFSLRVGLSLDAFNVNPIFKSQIKCFLEFVETDQQNLQKVLAQPAKSHQMKIILTTIKRFLRRQCLKK